MQSYVRATTTNKIISMQQKCGEEKKCALKNKKEGQKKCASADERRSTDDDDDDDDYRDCKQANQAYSRTLCWYIDIKVTVMCSVECDCVLCAARFDCAVLCVYIILMQTYRVSQKQTPFIFNISLFFKCNLYMYYILQTISKTIYRRC